ncbi:hypothetical protein AVEN_153982-1 [Araneus ventricosus]|uniref:Uncharacterized protein n=1 Tax=Araneus ventricosus TaxID=182803 RepID=A0A4Y2IWN6_ARAVE|nr:hypothetical protein AVEN_153982-1 [Araneus ventricosus]
MTRAKKKKEIVWWSIGNNVRAETREIRNSRSDPADRRYRGGWINKNKKRKGKVVWVSQNHTDKRLRGIGSIETSRNHIALHKRQCIALELGCKEVKRRQEGKNSTRDIGAAGNLKDSGISRTSTAATNMRDKVFIRINWGLLHLDFHMTPEEEGYDRSDDRRGQRTGPRPVQRCGKATSVPDILQRS